MSRRAGARHAAEQRRVRVATGAIAVVYVGGVAVVLLAMRGTFGAWSAAGVFGFGAVGGAAAAMLGSWRLTLGGLPRARDVPLAAAGGAITVAIGLAWVLLLSAIAGTPSGVRPTRPDAVELVEIAVLVPVVEEWACRGVLWEACGRVTDRRTTVLATALLFGFLHGPAWGLLGVPHRFLGGIVLGELRARTGSLVPPILAHGLNNAAALCLGEVEDSLF